MYVHICISVFACGGVQPVLMPNAAESKCNYAHLIHAQCLRPFPKPRTQTHICNTYLHICEYVIVVVAVRALSDAIHFNFSPNRHLASCRCIAIR